MIARTAPRTLVQSLKRYDRSLGVTWNGSRRAWVITRGGGPVMTWPHDNTDTEAILARLRAGDMWSAARARDAYRERVLRPLEQAEASRSRDWQRFQTSGQAMLEDALRRSVGSRVSVGAGTNTKIGNPIKE